MQVKKSSVKEKIMIHGEIEFIEKGFDKASLRQIVKAAGITTGNFYNYFKNKEALFDELVKKDLQLFSDFIQGHNEDSSSMPTPIDYNHIRKHMLTVVENFLPEFGGGLILLLDHSKGTQYEAYKSELIKEIGDHMRKHIGEMNPAKRNDAYVNIMAVQFLTGLTMIIKNYTDKKSRDLMIVEHIMFYIHGITGLIS